MKSTRLNDDCIAEEKRKEIFAALVKMQDAGTPVRTSRVKVAGRFSVTEDQVREVEREGLDQGWPPL